MTTTADIGQLEAEKVTRTFTTFAHEPRGAYHFEREERHARRPSDG